VAIAVLFVANLAVVAWLLVRHATSRAVDAPPAPVPARAELQPAAPAAALPAAAPTTKAPATAPTAVSAAPRSVASAPVQAPAAASTAEPPPNPDDLAPAAEPPPSGSLGRVKRGTDAGVLLYQQLAAAPGTQLPQLRLDLHAYAERAADRWVLVNMHKLREGDALEGVRVERITPDGAVLSYQGTQFLLPRE
jgi:general secretion pathway protein B